MPKLWYVGNFYSNTKIEAFTIPGLKYVYSIKGSGGGMCTLGRNIFWIADFAGDDLAEFDYGGTHPIKVLNGAPSGKVPDGCTIDPTTGNIAGSVFFTSTILVWNSATGSPSTLTDPLLETYFVGYDGSGDLFADGFTSSLETGLAELPKGSSTWTMLSLPVAIGFPGGIQWDGTDLAVVDQTVNDNVIDRFSCSGTSCTLAGTTPLTGSEDCDSQFIRKAVLACPDIGDDEGKLYHYPAGGEPYAYIPGVNASGVIVK